MNLLELDGDLTILILHAMIPMAIWSRVSQISL